jgi:hypothetical protein
VTDKDINNILKKLLDEIDVLRNQARNRGLAFSSPTAEQLEKKLKSAHTPFIYSIASTPSGSTGFNTFRVHSTSMTSSTVVAATTVDMTVKLGFTLPKSSSFV